MASCKNIIADSRKIAQIMKIPFTDLHIVDEKQTLAYQTGRSNYYAIQERIFGFEKDNFKKLVFLLAIALGIAAPAILAFKPDFYSVPVQIIFAFGLTWSTYWLGSQQTAEVAARKANDRWLPQAESVILGLMTLKADVVRLQRKMQKTCCNGYSDLEELQEEAFKAVRIKITTECEATADRLNNIKNHLENAIGDWDRFVTSNCEGEECARIYDAQHQREEQLERELQDEQPFSPLVTASVGNEFRVAEGVSS